MTMRASMVILAAVAAFSIYQAGAQESRSAQTPAIVNGRLVGKEVPADWPIEARTKTLTYTNPYGQDIAARWCDGEIVYRISYGEVKVDPATVKAAEEYIVVYKAPAPGEPWNAVERVPEQLPIYDTKPGDPGYNPLWHYNYVVVPRDYKPNTLRSEDQVKKSGYPVVPVNHYSN